MGSLMYGAARMVIEFDDRTLAHVQLVLCAKLRRGEAFFFSWKDAPSIGGGRSSVWIDRSIPLFFRFSSATRHVINHEWLETLTLTANSAQGMMLIEEPSGTGTPPAGIPASAHHMQSNVGTGSLGHPHKRSTMPTGAARST